MVATEWTLLESSFNGDRGGLRLATHGASSRSQGATCKYEQRGLVARAGLTFKGNGGEVGGYNPETLSQTWNGCWPVIDNR